MIMSGSSKNFKYDYYMIDLPEDVCDQESRAALAIYLAREQAALYVIPCEWSILWDDGNKVRVRRKRLKIK
jgi:hypothetical protein